MILREHLEAPGAERGLERSDHEEVAAERRRFDRADLLELVGRQRVELIERADRGDRAVGVPAWIFATMSYVSIALAA